MNYGDPHWRAQVSELLFDQFGYERIERMAAEIRAAVDKRIGDMRSANCRDRHGRPVFKPPGFPYEKASWSTKVTERWFNIWFEKVTEHNKKCVRCRHVRGRGDQTCLAASA